VYARAHTLTHTHTHTHTHTTCGFIQCGKHFYDFTLTTKTLLCSEMSVKYTWYTTSEDLTLQEKKHLGLLSETILSQVLNVKMRIHTLWKTFDGDVALLSIRYV